MHRKSISEFCDVHFRFMTDVIVKGDMQATSPLLLPVGSTVAIVCCTVCLLSSLIKLTVYKTRRRV